MFRPVFKILAIGFLSQTVLMTYAAHACQAMQFETTVFFSAMPAPAEDADTATDFIGEVTLKQKTEWFFFKQDKKYGLTAYIHESPTHPELEGKRIDVFPFIETSCGPGVGDGNRGFVSARTIAQDNPLPPVIMLNLHSRLGFTLPSE